MNRIVDHAATGLKNVPICPQLSPLFVPINLCCAVCYMLLLSRIWGVVYWQERWHRHNVRMAESRVSNYPRVGHYNTWLIDKLQLLVERTMAFDCIQAGWVNASDCRDTNESFVTSRFIQMNSTRPCLTMQNTFQKTSKPATPETLSFFARSNEGSKDRTID